VTHTTTKVASLPPCDFCTEAGTTTQAAVDGKTNLGPWAYMCEMHYATHGIGLGLGRGQRLVLRT